MGVGLSIPGIIGSGQDLVLRSHALSIQGLRADEFEQYLGLPCRMINEDVYKRQLQSKMDEFAASYATFDTGLDNALSGAQQVQSGAQNLLDGAKSLDNGTQQLADGTQQLNSGAQQLAGRLNGTLVPALEGAAAQQAALQQQMDALADQLGHVQLPDVDALKKQLGAGVGQVFDGAAPVSYTHLDVYKRQFWKSRSAFYPAWQARAGWWA